MTYEERMANARSYNHRMRAQRTTIEETIPAFANESMKLANGDAAKAREVANILSSTVPLMTVREWEANMTTAPGELVRAPDGKYVFAYAGKETMTHANPTFFPGATGVYYWAIVPDQKDGTNIWPNLTGIIVAVKKDQLWYNVAQDTLYRWNAKDWTDCIHAPGAAGVHQWVKETLL